MGLSDIQGRYPVQPQIRILLPVLGFFLPYFLLAFLGLSHYTGLGVILSCVAAGVIFFITKPYEKAETESLTKEKQIDDTTVQPIQINRTIIKGDYIDDRSTVIKDSVINRSKIESKNKEEEEES